MGEGRKYNSGTERAQGLFQMGRTHTHKKSRRTSRGARVMDEEKLLCSPEFGEEGKKEQV